MTKDLQDEKKTGRYVEAEQSVIGSLLIKNSCWDEIADTLNEDDFYVFTHRLIYKTICTLAADNKPFDILTLSDLLKQNGELDTVGGEIYLFELAHNTPTAANVKSYAEIVKRIALDRRLISVGHKIIESVNAQDENRIDTAQQLISDIANQTTNEVIRRCERLPHVLAAIDDRKGREGGISGLTTGFVDLDRMTAGMQNGELVVIGARPSQGKTAFVLNMADNATINHNKSVVIFSLEMDKDQLIERSIAGLARVNMHNLKNGTLSEDEWKKITEAVPALSTDKMIIDDRSSVSVMDIRAKCRKIKRENGLDLIIVDYISLMSGDGENETHRIGNISRGLKLIARDLNVPLIAISQLNRGLENRVGSKKPTMADLRQSGAIEQDADLIMFIYRDEVYHPETAEKGKAEIIISKNRNGAIGTVNLSFNGAFCRFDNYIEQARYTTEVVPVTKSRWQQYSDY